MVMGRRDDFVKSTGAVEIARTIHHCRKVGRVYGVIDIVFCDLAFSFFMHLVLQIAGAGGLTPSVRRG